MTPETNSELLPSLIETGLDGKTVVVSGETDGDEEDKGNGHRH